MQITEEMILDAIDNVKKRPEWNEYAEVNDVPFREIMDLALSQMGLELRRKLNDN